MLKYNLPDVPSNLVAVREFGGLIDVESVAKTWQEIIDAAQKLAAAADGLEAAAIRYKYTFLSDINKLTNSLMYIKDKMDGTSQQEGYIRLQPDMDMEYDTSLYPYRITMQSDVWDSSVISLPIESKEDYVKNAKLNVVKRCGREAEDSGIESLKNGGIWQSVVRTNDITRLEPAKEFYYVTDGVPCIIEAEFKRPYMVNSVIIEPCAPFPMDLIAIECYSPTGEVEVIVSPSHNAPERQSSLLLDKHTVSFEPVLAKSVRIILNQRHYRRVENSRAGRVFYEYEYGIKRLFIGSVKYQSVGQWLSRPIGIPVGTEAVQIAADDLIGEGQAIEYDVSINGTTWHPIVPEGVKEVVEIPKIYIEKGKHIAQLRFNVSEGLKVYAAGSLLRPIYDYMLDGQNKIVFIRPPRIPVIISYIPSAEHKEVSLKDYIKQVSEEFHGTDEKNRIRLKFIPYIDMDLIKELPENWSPSALSSEYVPINVFVQMSDGKSLSQPYYPGESGIVNITPYRSIPAQPGSILNYKCQGNVIEFDRPIDNSNRIVVTYNILPQTLRVRATLRDSGINGICSTSPLIKNLRIITNRRRTV